MGDAASPGKKKKKKKEKHRHKKHRPPSPQVQYIATHYATLTHSYTVAFTPSKEYANSVCV